ncbi:DUF397 domain-containing protein [Nocardia sp. NPDC005998]|uniref:DUF397 domain-containing protein n=1 Tax=Nocardia sp. NPDC005998 TaxID=3156894 RepID=UPI00339EEFD9
MSTDLVGAQWLELTRSGAGKHCVVFLDGGRVGVRDSKNPSGSALVFTPGAWNVCTAGVAGGEF